MKHTDESREFNRKLGKRLRELRKSLNLSQEEYSNEADLSMTFISSLERGVSGISAFNLEQLCKFFNISPNEMLLWDTEFENEELRRSYSKVSELSEAQQNLVIATIDAILEKIREQTENQSSGA